VPRGLGGLFEGLFGSYEGADDGGWANDEDAIEEAVDYMFSMCGNAGQESIIGRGLPAFETWGMAALEGIGGNDGNYGEYVGAITAAVGESAYFGSQEIWDAGYDALSQQSKFHDGKPDTGGTGVEF